MIARKLFKFCGAHTVRNTSATRRCSANIHGHNYVVEVMFESKKLDRAGMVVDFGLMKNLINDFIDSFDHAHSIWNKESKEFKDIMKGHSERWIEMPVSPSAEEYALMFLYVIDKIVKNTKFANHEGIVTVSSVRVHETDTGYAEAFQEDLQMVDFELKDIKFSDQVKEEWKNHSWWWELLEGYQWEMKESTQQIAC